ncbi:MAG: peptidase domain-containing ABC transporter [Cyanobacteriota bacterium]|nr:peptidase domain-containing ABC transporter [Cyanobacteriota bacterium]
MSPKFPFAWPASIRVGSWRRYICVRQLNEEDCGAACMATVCQAHGRRISIAQVRSLVGTVSSGTTLLGLRRGGESLGFHARAARADPGLLAQLDDLPLPVIVHWNGNHWVVLHGREGDRLVVADPAHGVCRLSESDFRRHWSNGVLLLLEPDPLRFDTAVNDSDTRPVRGFELLLANLAPFRRLVMQAFAVNVVIGLMALAMPLLMQILTDDVLVRGDSQMLASLCIGIMLLFGIRSLLSLLQGVMVGHFGQKLRLQMVLHYSQRLLQLPLSYFESRRSGEVVSRLNDIDQINDLISNLVLGLPSQLCVAAVSLLWMFTYSTSLTLAALAGYVLVVGFYLATLPLLHRRTQQLLVQSAENQGFLVELFRSYGLLKTTDAAQEAWQELHRNQGRIAHLGWSALMLDLRAGTLAALVGSLTSLALLWYGSTFVLADQLSIGQLLAFNGMGGNVAGFLALIGGLAQEGVTASLVIRRLADVLEQQPEDPQYRQRHAVTIPTDAPITCREISFHHPGRRPLLDRVSITIPGGQVTALIGESGCGKSTLSKLLAALYPLQSGTIHYGPFGGNDIALASLRRQVVLLPQDTSFLNRSIFANFSFAHPQIRFEEVVELCRLTLADDFIRDLPDGYRTVLGEFGANLSGGQRQRIALARALVGHPPVLILDESTSALDPVLESRLMDRLLAHRSGRTTLLISHRPSVILRADWIIFMEKGQVRYQDRPHNLHHTRQVSPYLQPV